MRRFFLFMALIAAPALAGCVAHDVLPATQQTPDPPSVSVVFAPGIDPARQQDIAGLLDQKPGTGKDGVRLLETYAAASGKTCSLLTDGGESWIACRAAPGPWTVRRALLPADTVFGGSVP